MKLHMLSVGTRAPVWLSDGFNEYNRRLTAEFHIHLTEIPVPKRSSARSTTQLVEMEGASLLANVQNNARIVALDVRGEQWSTEDLTDKFRSWQMDGRDLAFLIGGPDGLSGDCLQEAEYRWSLSRHTFPHFLVRVLVAEQIYRCWSLIHNHPYHKA